MTVGSLPLRRVIAPVRHALRGDFVRDGAIVFGATMVVNVLNYAIHFVLSRKLGVSEYGAFASLMSGLAILGIPASFMMLIVVKFTAEFHAVDDRSKIRVLSRRVFIFGSAFAAICLAAAAAGRGYVAEYLHLRDPGSVLAAAFSLSFALVLPAARGVLQGTQDFAALAISTASEAIGKIGFAVAFAYAGFGVSGVFAGYALASGLNLLYTIGAVRRHWDPNPTRLAIDSRRLLQTMGGVIVGTAAITFMGFVDVPLVKHFFGPSEAGIYGAVSVCGKMLLFLVGFIPTLVLPKATHRAANGGKPGMVLLQGLLMTLLFAVCGLCVFYAIPQIVVRITYGAAFLSASAYIFTYGVAMSLLGITNVIVAYNIGLHRYRFVVPLVALAIIEPIAIHFFHATLRQVIDVLLAGNAAAAVFCLLGTPFVTSKRFAGSDALETLPV